MDLINVGEVIISEMAVFTLICEDVVNCKVSR